MKRFLYRTFAFFFLNTLNFFKRHLLVACASLALAPVPFSSLLGLPSYPGHLAKAQAEGKGQEKLSSCLTSATSALARSTPWPLDWGANGQREEPVAVSIAPLL